MQITTNFDYMLKNATLGQFSIFFGSKPDFVLKKPLEAIGGVVDKSKCYQN